MINLLPSEYKTATGYARKNTVLRRWLISSLVGIVGLLLVVGSGVVYINLTINSFSKRIATAQEQLKVQKLEETQKRVSEMSDSFKLSTQVLSKQVLFSEMLKSMGSVMPTGSALSNLTIGSLEGGIDLDVMALNREIATQVQVNLADPKNKLFDEVDIVNIVCNESFRAQFGYLCQVQLKASFAKNNEFLLIPQSTSGVKQ
jgi:hypothetical protein